MKKNFNINNLTKEESKILDEMYALVLDRLFMAYIAEHLPPIWTNESKNF